LWLGLGDDYVGDDDSNDKIKGNIINGTFTPLSSLVSGQYQQEPLPSLRANAVLIGSEYPGVGSPITGSEPDSLFEFFFTDSSSGYAIAHSSYAWDFTDSNSALYYDPLNSASIVDAADGSYAIYYRLPDIAAGSSESVNTFFSLAPL